MSFLTSLTVPSSKQQNLNPHVSLLSISTAHTTTFSLFPAKLKSSFHPSLLNKQNMLPTLYNIVSNIFKMHTIQI